MWFIQPVEGLNRKKKTLGKGEFTLIVFELRQVFSYLWIQTWIGTYTIDSLSPTSTNSSGDSQVFSFSLQITGLLVPHNHISQFHVYFLLVLYLWKT